MGRKPGIEAIATEFVNLSGGGPSVTLAIKRFVREHRHELGLSDWPQQPPAIATKPGVVEWLHPPKIWNDLASAERVVLWRSLELRKAWNKSERELAERRLEEIFSVRGHYKHTAFQIRLGYDRPVFEPRDLLDRIAFVILKASKCGFLRMCQGHEQGWQCPTPYLVADEKRRVYCYMSCGDEAKSRAKHAWWKRNLSAGALRRKAHKA